jgi:hypothetical protein
MHSSPAAAPRSVCAGPIGRFRAAGRADRRGGLSGRGSAATGPAWERSVLHQRRPSRARLRPAPTPSRRARPRPKPWSSPSPSSRAGHARRPRHAPCARGRRRPRCLATWADAETVDGERKDIEMRGGTRPTWKGALHQASA